MKSSSWWDARQPGQMRGRSMERTNYSRPHGSENKNIADKLPDNLVIGRKNPSTGHKWIFSFTTDWKTVRKKTGVCAGEAE
jgi:hypothetical protein